MNIFQSRIRRRVEIEILKLRMQLVDLERERLLANIKDTKHQVDLIIRCRSIEEKIELYKRLL